MINISTSDNVQNFSYFQILEALVEDKAVIECLVVNSIGNCLYAMLLMSWWG